MGDRDELLWAAVIERDDTVNNVVYAVKTTGVFCRIGCKSRQPLRRNVRFFESAAEAIAAGFRPCQRCRPEEGPVPSQVLASVVELCRRVEDGHEKFDFGAFAAERGYSERHLRRRFVEIVGVPVAAYARLARADRVRTSLRSEISITRAIADAGYGSSRAFYEHGATQLGMSPVRYRGGARGERVAFTSLLTPLGTVVAASTKRGVCAVKIGDRESALIDELHREFPLATVVRDDDELSDVANVLADAVRGGAEATALPVDLEGTAFQMRVWNALRGVPYGETRTYSQLAERVGAPRAVRAVASACAANRVALVVPCHRIIRRDGALGGYRWGLETKRALLDAERTAVEARRSAPE